MMAASARKRVVYDDLDAAHAYGAYAADPYGSTGSGMSTNGRASFGSIGNRSFRIFGEADALALGGNESVPASPAAPIAGSSAAGKKRATETASAGTTPQGVKRKRPESMLVHPAANGRAKRKVVEDDEEGEVEEQAPLPPPAAKTPARRPATSATPASAARSKSDASSAKGPAANRPTKTQSSPAQSSGGASQRSQAQAAIASSPAAGRSAQIRSAQAKGKGRDVLSASAAALLPPGTEVGSLVVREGDPADEEDVDEMDLFQVETTANLIRQREEGAESDGGSPGKGPASLKQDDWKQYQKQDWDDDVGEQQGGELEEGENPDEEVEEGALEDEDLQDAEDPAAELEDEYPEDAYEDEEDEDYDEGEELDPATLNWGDLSAPQPSHGGPSRQGKGGRMLTHAEIWDDSALVDAWDAAQQEYELYHSRRKAALAAQAAAAAGGPSGPTSSGAKRLSALWHEAADPSSAAAKEADAVARAAHERALDAAKAERTATQAKRRDDALAEQQRRMQQDPAWLRACEVVANTPNFQHWTPVGEPSHAQHAGQSAPQHPLPQHHHAPLQHAHAHPQEHPHFAGAAPAPAHPAFPGAFGPRMTDAAAAAQGPAAAARHAPQSDLLQNVIMAWYWAGYYTAVYSSQTQPPGEQQQRQ